MEPRTRSDHEAMQLAATSDTEDAPLSLGLDTVYDYRLEYYTVCSVIAAAVYTTVAQAWRRRWLGSSTAGAKMNND